MIIVYGINSLYYDFVGASPISGFDSGFSTFAQGFIALGSFRLSYITFYALIAVVFVWVLWNKTRFGKNIFAIGGNPEAVSAHCREVAYITLSSFRVNPEFQDFSLHCYDHLVKCFTLSSQRRRIIGIPIFCTSTFLIFFFVCCF